MIIFTARMVNTPAVEFFYFFFVFFRNIEKTDAMTDPPGLRMEYAQKNL